MKRITLCAGILCMVCGYSLAAVMTIDNELISTNEQVFTNDDINVSNTTVQGAGSLKLNTFGKIRIEAGVRIDLGGYFRTYNEDSDSDGIQDNWEILYLGGVAADPTGDADGDGLNNLDEFLNGTKPNDADSDNDGFNDNVEVLAGTDPNDGGSVPAATIWYVKADATGSNDGTSWTDAFTSFASAISAAQTGDTVWVASGTYKPGVARTDTFVIGKDLSIFGGFIGTETALNQRNISTNSTIISGDINSDDVGLTNNTENIFTLITVNNSAEVLFNGFTLRGGHSNGSGQSQTHGGAVYVESSATFTSSNNTFSDNNATKGAAIYSEGILTSLSDAFTNNVAADGSGIAQLAGEITISGTYLISPGLGAGSALDINAGTLSIENAVVHGHVTGLKLRGTFVSASINNSTIVSNTATGIDTDVANLVITNSIFWGNVVDITEAAGSTVSATYSIIDAQFTGTGNQTSDPSFVNITDVDGADNVLRTADDGLLLHIDSPAFNTAENGTAASTDIVGVARPQATTADIGAYEIDMQDSNANGMVDYFELLYFGDLNHDPNGDEDGDGISNATEIGNGSRPNDANSTPSDAIDPSVPQGLVTTQKSESSISISWNASTDNIAVKQYRVSRDGAEIAVVATTSLSDSGLNPSTQYSYTVIAEDFAGNTSAASTALVESTNDDTQAPTVPTNVVSETVTSSTLTLTWTGSIDNIGVTSYKVYRGGVEIGQSVTPSYDDTGLTPETAYTYTVTALDGAGNESNASQGHNVTTLAAFVDTDLDGMDDGWETTHFGDLSAKALENPDGDDFTNLQEFLAGSDPNLLADVPADTDLDGMPDYWEALYNLTDPNGDEDTDGVNNLTEFQQGRNPTVGEVTGDASNVNLIVH